jgi:hypothetical protein
MTHKIGVLGFLGLGSAALYKHFNELAGMSMLGPSMFASLKVLSRIDYQDKLNSAKSALAAEVAKQGALTALKPQLIAATTTMENMAGKLNGMGKIFGHVCLSAMNFQSGL